MIAAYFWWDSARRASLADEQGQTSETDSAGSSAGAGNGGGGSVSAARTRPDSEGPDHSQTGNQSPGTAVNSPEGSTVTSSSNNAASTASNGQSGDGEGEQGSNNSPAASTTCKKGVGYNDAKYTEKLDICWGYNWASSGEIKQGAMYVPMLWEEKSLEGWSDNAKKAIEAGATHILGFNEPDLAEQAHMSPSKAAELWKSEIESFSSSAKLVSPAVTNGVKAEDGSPMGVPWLHEFISACDGCTIDAVALHWYDSAENTDYFTAYLTEAQAKLMKPIWLTEFMGTGTPEAQKKFLEFAVPWLEDQDWIERYAAFGCFKDNEIANFIASDDGSLNELGQAYSGAK
ncbi:glycoside hydrolase family protein [Rhodotorula paludigena]|uniref:glycoside hydrolase family protein n=1 Tax=Rhodotorula paludigena TaxID=86838 RepID=UPI00317A1FC8